MPIKDVVMRLDCVECGTRYNLADNEIEDYNVYWVFEGKVGKWPRPRPKLLCPKCTKKAVANL